MAKPTAPARRRKTASKQRSISAAADAPGDLRESVIVYVHGIGQQAPPDEVKLAWELALFGKNLGTRSRMAYWADLLHPPAAKTAKSARRASTGTSPQLDVDALLAVAGVPKDDEDAQRLASALLDRLGVVEAPIAGGGVGKKVLPLPGALRRPVSRAFLESFIIDTAAYFVRDGMRARIRQRLIDQLKPLPANQPVTIVAHSQGSIVAYEVLSAIDPQALALDALVTIGSPLGIREVRTFSSPARSRSQRWWSAGQTSPICWIPSRSMADCRATFTPSRPRRPRSRIIASSTRRPGACSDPTRTPRSATSRIPACAAPWPTRCAWTWSRAS